MHQFFDKICRRFAFSANEFIAYTNTAPYRYKTYRIPKRNTGSREISQPSKDLKILQRYILDEFLKEKFKYHSSATAYREQMNIADNARPHLQNCYLLKMDFKDFFPSIRSEDFEKYLLESGCFNVEDDAKIMAKIFFKNTAHGLRLSIGSPGSPSISNALMLEFDQLVAGMAMERGVEYTRYSDDLTFSTSVKNTLFEFPKLVDAVLAQVAYPRLSVNAEKTVFSSKKFNRHVTGITISNDGKMSLGHRNKRKLRSRVHSAGSLNRADLFGLKGYLSFAHQIEPDFVEKLRKKYPEQMSIVDAAKLD